MSDDPKTLTVEPGTLTYVTDRGTPIVFTDQEMKGYGPELATVERTVLVARLRAWADLIETDEHPNPARGQLFHAGP